MSSHRGPEKKVDANTPDATPVVSYDAETLKQLQALQEAYVALNANVQKATKEFKELEARCKADKKDRTLRAELQSKRQELGSLEGLIREMLDKISSGYFSEIKECKHIKEWNIESEEALCYLFRNKVIELNSRVKYSSLLKKAFDYNRFTFLKFAFEFLQKEKLPLPKLEGDEIPDSLEGILFLKQYGIEVDINHLFEVPGMGYGRTEQTLLTKYAKRSDYERVVKLVKELGANVNADNSPDDSRRYGEEYAQTTLHKLLYDIAENGNFGNSPANTIRIIRFLIASGAKLNKSDEESLKLTEQRINHLMQRYNNLGWGCKGYDTEEEVIQFFQAMNEAVSEGLQERARVEKILVQDRQGKVQDIINSDFKSKHKFFDLSELTDIATDYEGTATDEKTFQRELEQKRQQAQKNIHSLFDKSDLTQLISDFEGKPEISNETVKDKKHRKSDKHKKDSHPVKGKKDRSQP